MKPSSTSENILLMLIVLLVIAIAGCLFWYEAKQIVNRVQGRVETVVQI